MALDSLDNSLCTPLDSSTITEHCRWKRLYSSIHTLHYCMVSLLQTSYITAPHTTETLPFSQLHASLNTPSLTTQYSSQDTRNTLYCIAFSLCSTLLPYWIRCLFHCMPYTISISPWIHHPSPLDANSQDRQYWLSPGYHSMIEHGKYCTPHYTHQVPDTARLIDYTYCSGLDRCMNTAGTHCSISFQYTRCSGMARYPNTACAQD